MEIKIKSMTRGQIKELRKAGFDLARLQEKDTAVSQDALDWIFDNVYPELANDDTIPYNEVVRVAVATYRKTYGSEEEIKN